MEEQTILNKAGVNQLIAAFDSNPRHPLLGQRHKK